MIRASHENPETTAPMPCNMTSAPETDAAPPEKIDRDELLSISSALIKSLDRRRRDNAGGPRRSRDRNKAKQSET